MIEDRHIELIHAELDGELTSEQRAELSRVLLANPEARALRDELNRLFGALAKLEDAEPPRELPCLRAERDRRTPGPAQSVRRSWYTGPVFRYAAVFVGWPARERDPARSGCAAGGRSGRVGAGRDDRRTAMPRAAARRSIGSTWTSRRSAAR